MGVEWSAMTESNSIVPELSVAEVVGAIDIGSNLIRMVIAEVLPDQQIKILEQLQRPVRLGQDTFRRGRLSTETMRAAVAVLRDYRRRLDLYKIKHIRTVATSSVREADNADTFLDRVSITTNLDVEVIDTSEESRLMVSVVRQTMGKLLEKDSQYTLIVEVGGGSTLLTLLYGAEILNSLSLPLGAIRLQESLATNYESPERAAEMLSSRIASELMVVSKMMPLRKVRKVVAVGGDARLAARQVGKPGPLPEMFTVSQGAFDGFVNRCRLHTPEELVNHFGLIFSDAETLIPALLVFHAVLHKVGARQILVSSISMRDGLLLDLARLVTGQEDESLTQGVTHSALSLSRKYRVDLNHAEHVAELAVRLFDELQAEHGLTRRHRVLLRVAGLLHEVGDFVSSRSHHKHSYYLIANSEIFGLNRTELMTVAMIARYHRRSVPKPTHTEYMNLPREQRMEVSKLAAILRVADSLDVGHAQQVRVVRYERQGEELVLYVTHATDLSLERRSVLLKGGLLEDIYGIKVRLEEERHGGPGQKSKATPS